jgi:ribonucleoside-triphosphate reductase
MSQKEYDILKSKRQPTECYSRVVGYIRPVNQWNEGKAEEFKSRKMFVIPKDL